MPTASAGPSGAFDVVYEVGSTRMGYITARSPSDRRVSDFAPPIRTGSDPAFSDGVYQQWVIQSFHEGGDRFLFQNGDRRYQWSNGGVATHREDLITMASAWSASGTDHDAGQVATARQIVDLAGVESWVCLGVGTKIRAYRVGTPGWSTQGGAFAGNAISIFATDQYLFVAIGTAGDFWRWDGTAAAGWSQPAAGIQARAFTFFRDTLYRCSGRAIYPATNNSGATWGVAINVGFDNTVIEDIFCTNGLIVITKPEGLFIYDGSTVNLVVDAYHSRALGNFRDGVYYKGSVYVPWLNVINKIAISSSVVSAVSDVTPRMRGDSDKEAYGHGTPRRLFSGPSALFCALNAGENTYPELLRYNDIGWHQVYRGAAAATMNAAGFSRLMGWLLVNDGATRRKRIINTSDAEYPDHATSGQVTSSRYDAGMPKTLKSFSDISVKHRNCDALNTILIEYNADDAGWVSAGTISGQPADNQTKISFGGLDVQVAAYELQLRLTLTRDPADITDGPVIEMPIVVGVLPTPDATHAFSDIVVISESMPLRNNQGIVGDLYTVAQMLEFLDVMEDTPEVIIRTDEYGIETYVKNTDYSRGDDVRDTLRRGTVTAGRVALTFIEAFTGLKRSMIDLLTITDSITGTLQDAGGAYHSDGHYWGAAVYNTS